jgi:nucleosome assembly protein 1-like 1
MVNNEGNSGEGAAAGAPIDLPADVLARVEELKKFDAEYKTLEKQQMEEHKQIELKYLALKDTTFKARSAIVKGETDVANCPAGHHKGIPGFWLRAFQNSNTLQQFIEKRDVDALKYLIDVSCELLPEQKGFKLVFTFDSNPFFEETVLTKSFHMKHGMFDDEEDDEEEHEHDEEGGEEEIAHHLNEQTGVSKIVGCDISWKPTKNLTVEIQTKKPKGGRGGKKAKPVKKEVPVPSFFRFFETPDLTYEGADEEALMELIQSTGEEVRVAYFLKEELIPKALGFFLGEEEEEEDEEDEDDEDEDEDDEDGEDEDEEDEEEDEKPPRRGGKSGGAGKGRKDDGEALAASFSKKVSVAPPPVPGSDAPAPGSDAAAGGEQPKECKQQ